MYYTTQSTVTTHAHPWVQSILWTCIWWVVLSVGAMLWAAPAIRHMAVGTTSPVKLGPFTLISVVKASDAATHGFTFTYTVHYGMLLLGISCFIVQAALFIGLPVLLRARNHTTMVRNR
jgi:hypothetical protein